MPMVVWIFSSRSKWDAFCYIVIKWILVFINAFLIDDTLRTTYNNILKAISEGMTTEQLEFRQCLWLVALFFVLLTKQMQ